MEYKEKALTDQLKELQQLIEHLKSENFQLREIIDNVPGDVYWKNLQGVWLGVNARGSSSLEKMGFPFKPEDILGKTDEQLFGKAIAKTFRENDLKVLQSQKEISQEESAILITGEKIVQISIKKPLFNEAKKIIGIIGNTVDITYLKKIEQDLLTAKNAAEVANRAKTEFLANMSHDVKTPLLGINILANDLYQKIDEKYKQDAELILSCQKQLSTFFKNCLDNANFELASKESFEEMFSIRSLLNEMRDLFIANAHEKQLFFNIDTDESVPAKVIGYRFILFRVILNLVSNALKFTDQGGITIKSSLLSHTENDKFLLRLSVHDTGIGIPEDKKTLIFERLSRLAPAFSKRIEGSGIGLYIVDQYVKTMQGDIQVKSAVGSGSTFTVTLPLKIASNDTKKR